MADIVLIHGAWAGSWVWDSLQDGLRSAGVLPVALAWGSSDNARLSEQLGLPLLAKFRDQKALAKKISKALGRNDVGRVARIGTVRVTDYRRIERYSVAASPPGKSARALPVSGANRVSPMKAAAMPSRLSMIPGRIRSPNSAVRP